MQVLAVTGNASLVVALGSMMRDWEVVTVRSAEEAVAQGTPSMVALIDMGATNQGIEIADDIYRRGLRIPGVVIGDVPAEHPRIGVLVRPFSLEDLSLAVREAAQQPLASAVPASTVETPAPTPRQEAPVAKNQEVASAAAAGSPAQAATATAPAKKPEPTPAPQPHPQPTVDEAPKRPLSVVRQPKEAVEPPPVEEPAALVEAPVIEEEDPTFWGEEPSQPEAPMFEESEVEDAPAARSEQVPVYEEPVYAPAPPAPPPAQVSAPVAREPAPQEERRRGFRRKAARPMRPAASVGAGPDEPPLVKHLTVAARNLADLEKLLVELPFLEDHRSMAAALVGEVEAQFDSQTVAVFAPAEDGFQPIAYSGLSRVEAGMVVPPTQPLFSDVISTKDGILIQPVDLAQGLVAGIGGARTEAMMAAPAVLDDEVIAIVVIGSERFNETDLDRLSDIAAEAAPGLAVALRLRELRSRVGMV